MSCPKRIEWVKMNLDTGAAVNAFSLNFGPDRAEDGRCRRTASAELGSFQVTMKTVCVGGAGEIGRKGRQYSTWDPTRVS